MSALFVASKLANFQIDVSSVANNGDKWCDLIN